MINKLRGDNMNYKPRFSFHEVVINSRRWTDAWKHWQEKLKLNSMA
jgi:hypothetical protein